MDQKFLIRMLKPDEDALRLELLNTASSPARESGGRGLTSLKADMEAFGAYLDVLPVEAPWTYGVSLLLPLWKGM